MSVYLTMSFLRHDTQENAFKILERSKKYKDQIKAVGLDSSEKDNPPSKFKDVYKDAVDKYNYLPVAHAGEEGPPAYIWEAINVLGVKRIDHGVRCIEDEKLLEHLKKTQIGLTCCPLSNTKLKVF